MKLAVVGAGWAGMAAAVTAVQQGAAVTVFEAQPVLGGRARALPVQLPDGRSVTLDNGQHILIGAYHQTLALLQTLGVDLEAALLRLPLGLPRPDGSGLLTPAWASHWPPPLDALAAMATAGGWTWGDRLALLHAAFGWRLRGFVCPSDWTVARLCQRLPPTVIDGLIEPLCVSALNIPSEQASAQIFLNVLRDALFGRGHAGLGPAHLLLPRTDLSELLPEAAARWLLSHPAGQARLLRRARVQALQKHNGGWRLQGMHAGQAFEANFDQVVWATPPGAAAQVMQRAAAHDSTAKALGDWAGCTAALGHTAIATVYLHAPDQALSAPLLALPSGPDAPAQFVFDRGQLRPHETSLQGVLAFVISAADGDQQALQAQVIQQAKAQLGLRHVHPLQTVVERRATFACTPGLSRPAAAIAPGLWAAGDYVDGPYPATLEGAVRSGIAAVRT